MNTVELNCPQCGATIHVDEDLVSFDCPNCGSRIMLTKQPDPPVTRSVPTERLQEQPSTPKKQRSPLRGVVAAILAVAVVSGAGFVGSKVYTENQITKSKESVWEYVDQKDFTRARSELGTLFGSHWLYKEKWVAAENALSEEIDKKEQEYIQEQKKEEEERKKQEEKERKEQEEKEAAIEAAKEQNAHYPIPMSRKEAVGTNVDEVKKLFREAKLINFVDKPITTVNAKEAKEAENGIIKSLSIKVDGKEISLKKGELVRCDAEIIIEYYDFSNSPAVPMSAKDGIGKKYEEVEKAFLDLFPNTVPKEYVEKQDNWFKKLNPFSKNRLEKKTGTVKTISIHYNEKDYTDFGEGARFPSDSIVTITYYKKTDS